jgi:hypothetical protein
MIDVNKDLRNMSVKTRRTIVLGIKARVQILTEYKAKFTGCRAEEEEEDKRRKRRKAQFKNCKGMNSCLIHTHFTHTRNFCIRLSSLEAICL